MLSKDCKDCKYLIWLVGIGQGIRCKKPENQIKNSKLPINISYIKECKYYDK